MQINKKALTALELKLAEYSKENGPVAEHESSNVNCVRGCSGICSGNCEGTCKSGCVASCQGGASPRYNGNRCDFY